MYARALNLWVFRESRRTLCGAQCKSVLLNELGQGSTVGSLDTLVRALLRAGELECGIEDGGKIFAEPWRRLTDRFAEALISPGFRVDGPSLSQILGGAEIPDHIEVSPPEGFAYYALDPLAFADAIANVPNLSESVAVVGIRSIGTTLSAVVAAAARDSGKQVERITVRPVGHPYNRSTTFSPQQVEFVRDHANRRSSFLIVDEGPGLSGSSFLSVAEAVEGAGVPRERISLLCSHEPKFDDLCADNGPCRARRFTWLPVSSDARLPQGTGDFIGGGEWRKRLFDQGKEWPGSWVSFERLKYLSAQGSPTRLFKFIGLGHYGDAVLDRELQVSESAFGPAPSYESHGFASYPWVASRPMSSADLSNEVMERLAAYCAFRLQMFPAGEVDIETLQRMADHNVEQLGLPVPCRLVLERPVIADASMQPHEWLLAPGGQMLKSDSGSHGDDHFFPGPTDIAWDLAGAIVEWKMTRAESQHFLERYRAASGDDASRRIGDFLTAYAAFRCAYCLMAANALAGSEEQARLDAAAQNYQAILSRSAGASLACS